VSERESATTTEVEIFGATYVIRGGQQPEYLNELAEEVDRRMRELAGHVAAPEAGRLAILAALNLADELSRSRTSWDGERSEIETRLTSLTNQLAKALDEGRGGKRGRAARKIENRGNP
jgi:cell division protein ZapA